MFDNIIQLVQQHLNQEELKTIRNIQIITLFVILASVDIYVLAKLRMKIEIPGLICMGLYFVITFLRTLLFLMDIK